MGVQACGACGASKGVHQLSHTAQTEGPYTHTRTHARTRAPAGLPEGKQAEGCIRLFTKWQKARD